MQTEGQERKEKLIKWHEEHLDYYNKFIVNVTDERRKGLKGVFGVLSQVMPQFQGKVVENVQSAGNATVSLDGEQSKNFTQILVKGVDDGDDYSSAVCYWFLLGDGFEQLFLMMEEDRLTRKSLFGLNPIPRLLRKYEQRLVEASLSSGMRSTEQWRTFEREFNFGREKDKIDVSSLLPEEMAKEFAKPDETKLEEDLDKKELNEAEKKLLAAMNCGEGAGFKVIRYIERSLTNDPSGKNAAYMIIALEETSILKKSNFKAAYNLLLALNIPGLVVYRTAQGEYSPLHAGIRKGLPKYEDDEKAIDAIKASLLRITNGH